MSFGMPFEVWKTHMGTYRKESTIESFQKIYSKGGISSFWSGWQPKLVESFLKGEWQSNVTLLADVIYAIRTCH